MTRLPAVPFVCPRISSPDQTSCSQRSSYRHCQRRNNHCLQDGIVAYTDLRNNELVRWLKVTKQDAAVPSIVMNPLNESQFFCCAGCEVLGLDFREVTIALL